MNDRIATHPLPIDVQAAAAALVTTLALIDEAIRRLTEIVDSQAQRIARLEARVDTHDDDLVELGSSS